MKIISDISLKDFSFWSGARDCADKLTDEQFEQVESELEDIYPDGMNDVQLNDMFWFEPDFVYELAGICHKCFKLTASCGRVKYVTANNVDDIDTIELSGIDYEEVDSSECDDAEDVEDVDVEDFEHMHYFNIWSRHNNRKMVIFCQGDDAADDLKESFSMCKVEEISNVPSNGIKGEENWEDYEGDYLMIDEFAYDEDEMWNIYDIPVYAITRVCKLILDPNDLLDYYEVPESHAINEYNRDLKLNDEDIKNIDEFVADINKVIPQGFTIDWDAESVVSPYFEPYPAFGKAMDCVKLRVYPKKQENVDD